MKQFNKKRKYKGKQIFCNVPILHSLQFNPTEDMGQFLIEDGVCIVDEGGIEFNNRAYKTLPKSVINFAKLYRHYGITSFLFFSQGMDIDVTFVRLCDRICIVRKSYLPYFICIREVKKYIGIDELTRQLIDAYEFKFIGRHLVFAPTCWKYFDTYETPPLKAKTFYEWNNISRFTLDKSENGEISNFQNVVIGDEKIIQSEKTPSPESLEKSRLADIQSV